MATEPVRIEFAALPAQLAFIRSTARETLLSGGLGAGKSLALCLRLVMRAAVPGARELLVRKTNAAIGRSVLKTLLEGDGATPPVLPAGTYNWAKVEQVVRIKGGGEIHYTGVDDPQRLGSVNATGAAVEEAVELSEADYRMVRGRVRVRLDELEPAIYGVTNPGGPEHHLAKRFGLDGRSKPAAGTAAMFTSTDDNPHLPEEYIADIGAFRGADRERFFAGRWIKATGLVYRAFDPSGMVARRDRDGFERIVVGQDAGFNDPDALIVVGKDGRGALHVFAEFVESGNTTDVVVARAKDFRDRFRPETFAVDPSAARLREEMAKAGLNVEKAHNAILDGIRAVQRYMVQDLAGPLFSVDPSCEALLRELASYAWHPTRTDVPLDRDNHALDALRYGVMALDGAGLRTFYIGGSDDEYETLGERLNNEAGREPAGAVDRLRTLADPLAWGGWGFDD